jgi:hypothetical protein
MAGDIRTGRDQGATLILAPADREPHGVAYPDYPVTTSPTAFATWGAKLSTTVPWGEARYVGRTIAAHKLPRVVPWGEARISWG